MCGIFGVIGVKDAAKTVLTGLQKLEYRGYDSWGITVCPPGGRLVRERHIGKIGGAKTHLVPASLGLGHTRWATHGGVTEGNAHPHFSCDKNLGVVHNGIVENFLALKEPLLKTHKFLSQTDTEVAVHLIEEQAKKLLILEALRQSFLKLNGMNALIVLAAKTKELLAVKNGSPLIIGLGKNANYISSDVWALLDYTNRVIILEDGQMARIKADQVEVFEAVSGRQIKPKIVLINWQSEQGRLGNFHHYMEKEIYDQPQILNRLSVADFKTVRQLIKPNKKIYFLACGTAYYAALFGEYYCRKLGFCAEAVMASEYRKILNTVKPGELVLALSQSGETIDLLQAVKALKEKKLLLIALTNVLGSSLYRLADKKILLGAGQEVAVASTKALTAKLAVIINLFGGKGQLIRQAAALPKDRQKIKTVAQKIKDSEHIFVIGKDWFYPIALEAALKIKEVSYIHAEGFAAGELKHGPIALIDQGTPCLILAGQDSNVAELISAAYELKARGGLIIGIAPEPDKVFDIYLPIASAKEATVIASVITAQLLAYDLAVSRGLNPDKPRNLAKSVTVK